MPCPSHPRGTEAPHRFSGGRKVVQVRRDGGPVSPDPRADPPLYHPIGLPVLPFLPIRHPILSIPAAPAVTAVDASPTVLVIPSAPAIPTEPGVIPLEDRGLSPLLAG